MVAKAYPGEQVFIGSTGGPWPTATDRSLLIVVDTHSVNFVEHHELLERIPRVVVIDHHRMMVSHIKNALIFYHEPYASSASEMVTELVQYIKGSAIGQRRRPGPSGRHYAGHQELRAEDRRAHLRGLGLPAPAGS